MKNCIRFAFACLLLVPLMQQAPRAQHTAPGVPGTSKIEGKILDAAGAKVRDARVLAYHLSSETLFTSEPTGGEGEFRITDLPYGYFDLAVETSSGLFVADRVVNLAPAGSVVVIFTLAPFRPGDAGQARRHPGREVDPSGTASLSRKPKGREFWRSPKGVAIIAGVAGAGLLAIAVGSDDEFQATAF
jgi:hypothetical protein